MASRKEYQMDFMLNAKLNGGFSGTMTKAQQQFTKIGNEIQKLNKTQGDISAYTKQQNAVEKTRAKLENLQKQHDLLQKEIEQTGEATESLEREKLKLEQSIDKTQDALQNQEAKLEGTSQRLQEAGVNTENLTEESERLTNELHELEEQQERTASQSASLGEQMADAFDKLGQAIDILGLQDKFAAIADAYKECVDTAASLEATMSNVGAISGASGDEMVELTDKAREMGATTKFTATEAGDAFSYMAKHTWPTTWEHVA